MTIKSLYSLAAEEDLLRLKDERVRMAVLRALEHDLRKWEDRGDAPIQKLMGTRSEWLILAVFIPTNAEQRPQLKPDEDFNPELDTDDSARATVYYILYRWITSNETMSLFRYDFAGYDFFVHGVAHRDTIVARLVDDW
ncbi:MAG: hypothetical protein LC808_31135 [Actinobacteria bacterium]|nr:hypothetical protein [Actinomycetota bacterium]